MNQRERILAAIVGCMLLTMFSLFVVGRIRDLFDSRHDRISQLESDLNQQRQTLNRGKLASKTLQEYASQSLPGDRTLARSVYQEWLLERAVKCGFSELNVSPLPGKPNGDLCYQHTFLVSGRGDLKELTQFLYGLHSTTLLHRINRLTAKPITGTNDLDLSITMDALSLNSAPNTQSLDKAATTQLTHGDLEHYVDAITRRNVYGPANKPPELTLAGTQTAHPGQPLRFQVRARDPDKNDKLSYGVEGESLAGARLDDSSGQFEWTPEKLGEYEIAFRVTDNGLPAKSQVGKVKINVVEPPPPPAPQIGFDPAQQSVLTGITEIGGKRQVWITVRTEGRVLKLFEGDEFAVGTMKGTIQRIDSAQAEIKTDAGQVLTVALGKSLLAPGGPSAANL